MEKQPILRTIEESTSPLTTNVHQGHRQRLKQQLLEHGAATLNDHQLLELLLFYTIPRKDTNPMAHDLLRRFGSLRQVLNASPEELLHTPGITEHTAALFCALPELFRRTIMSEDTKAVLSNRQEAEEYLRPYFQGLREEHCILVSLNQRNRVVGCDLLSTGSHCEVTLDRQTLIHRATSHRAAFVLLAHNHPGGEAFPSDDDLFATQQCKNLLKMVGITLRDHLIFSDTDCCSIIGRLKR